jgi:AcrR family transcriptional regulator
VLDTVHTCWYVDVMDPKPGSARAAAARKSRKHAMVETREALILAGLAEFVEHGFDSPSLDRICARAGYTRGAFYVHFENREDFIVAVMEARLVSFIDTILGGAGESEFGSTVRRFTSALVEMVNSFSQDGSTGPVTVGGITIQLHRLIDAAERSPRIRSRLVSVLGSTSARIGEVTERQQSAGTVRADVDPALLGELLVVLSIGAITAAEAGMRLQPERAGEALIQLLEPL